ncbi:MAG TPA: hypothetical protein VFR10_11945, partial [bacterium]|nr:hypothetical protein [bacterium]
LRVRSDIVKLAGGTLDFEQVELAHALLDFESLRVFLKKVSSPDSQRGQGRDLQFRRVRLRDVTVRHADVVLKSETSATGKRWLAADLVHSFDGNVAIEGHPGGHHVRVQVDSLRARGRFSAADTIPAEIAARGVYDSPKIHADQLTIRTERTALNLHGDITIENRRVDFRQANVTLAAHSVSFEDLVRLVPPAPDEGTAELDVQLAGGVIIGKANVELPDASLAIPSLAIDLQELPNWKAKAELGPSRWKRRSLSSATVDFSASGEKMDVAANVQALGGNVQTRTRISGSGEDRLFEIHEAVFQHLDLATWTERENLTSDLNGSLRGKLQGSSRRTMRIDAAVDLLGSTMSKVRIDSGNVQGALANGILQSSMHLVREANEVDFAGTIEPFAEPFRVHGTAHGRGLLGDTPVDTLFTAFELAGDSAYIDSLSVLSPVAAATGKGTISWGRSLPDSSFLVHANLKNLSSLAPRLHVDTLMVYQGVLDAALSGRIQEPLVDAIFQADSLRAGSTRLQQVKARVDSDVSAKSAAFELAALDDSSRASSAKGKFAYVKNSAYPYRLDLEAVEFPIEAELWHLEAPSSLALARDRVRVHELKLNSGDAHVQLDGEINRSGSQDLHAVVQSLNTRTIASLLRRPIPRGL